MPRLVDAAVRVGQRLAVRGRDEAARVMELVEQYNDQIMTRIGYLVLAEAGRHLPERVNRILRSEELRDPGSQATEIAFLLRSQFRNAAQEVRKQYAEAVEAGLNQEELKALFRRLHGRDPTEGEINDYIRDYQRRILTFFRGDVPEELCDLAERLGVLGVTPSRYDQQMAEIGSSDAVERGVWPDEESPFRAEELAELSVPEIVALLVESGSGAGIGSSAGPWGTLMTYAEENPATALAVLSGAIEQGVDPRAIEGIVDGLVATARAGSELDWATALQGVRGVLSRTRSAGRGGGTSVSYWRRTAGSAARFVEEGCNRNSIGHRWAGEIWGILGEAMTAPGIWGVPHSTDRSLASVVAAKSKDAAGQVASTVLSAALWQYRSLLADEQSASDEAKACARVAVQEQLVPLLDCRLQDGGPNAPVWRAVLGHYLPQLHLVAPEWVEAHAADLFDDGMDAPASQPTWTTYISRCDLYDAVFHTARPWYLRAAKKADVWREAVGDSAGVSRITERYGEHLMVAVLRGLVSVGHEDSLLETAYETLDPSDWHRAYWGVFRGWSDTDDPPPADFIRRLLALWEWRVSQLETNPDSAATVEEAKELGWFFHTPHIPDADIVRLGLRTARLAQGQLQMYSRWNRMLSLAQADPNDTFSIAEAVLLAELKADYPHVAVEDVKAVPSAHPYGRRP